MCEVTNWSWRTWMTTKRRWLPSLPRWAKTFSILYVFYAFALSDSNDADRNLNWRNVKQMVPTRFGIREGLIALQELRMLTLVSHSVPRERHRGDLKKVVLSFCFHCSEKKLLSLEVGFYNFTIGDEVTDSNKSLRPLRESLRRSDEGGVVFF